MARMAILSSATSLSDVEQQGVNFALQVNRKRKCYALREKNADPKDWGCPGRAANRFRQDFMYCHPSQISRLTETTRLYWLYHLQMLL